jgi:hypothetical protein
MDETLIPAELLVESPPISDEEWVSLLDYAEAHAMRGDDALVMEDIVGDNDVEPLFMDAPPAARWRIEDESDAAWAMARLCEAVAEEADVDGMYAAMIDRLHGAREARIRRPRASAAFMRAQLARWGHERRLDDPKGPATFHLPTGRVVTTEYKAKAQIADQEAVIDWVKRALPADVVESIVKSRESVTVTDLRKHVRVAEVPVSCDVTLACGHVARVDEPTAVGEVVHCDLCALDIDIMQPIAEIGSVYLQVAVVADESTGLQRTPVPGTRVEHSHVDVRVEPR